MQTACGLVDGKESFIIDYKKHTINIADHKEHNVTIKSNQILFKVSNVHLKEKKN